MSLQYNLNKNADTNNIMHITASASGCCNEQYDYCAYAASVVFPVASLIAKDKDGNDVTATFTTPATTASGLVTAINDWIKNPVDGGGLGAQDCADNERGINATETDTGADLELIGVVEFVSVDSNGSAVNFEKRCVTYKRCDCQVVGNYSTNADVTYNGVTETLAIPATGDAAGLQVLADAAVIALALPQGAASVTEDTDGGFYRIIFSGEFDCSEITNGTSASESCGCCPAYKA